MTFSLHSHNTMESHPLISTIITLYTLIFLYFPTIAASPLIISTSLLLLSLLRLGATQRISQEQIKKKKPEPENPSLQVPRDDPDSEPILDPVPIGFHDDCFVESNVDSNCEKLDLAFDNEMNLESDSTSKTSSIDENCSKLYKETKDVILNRCRNSTVLDTEPKPEPEPRPFYNDSFVEWNVRAPLEVIYEAYEGEEEEEYTEEKRRNEELRAIERYASLSMYYPETDTDTDSSSGGDSPVTGNWDSPDNVCFRWDEEDREEELMIEIELDCKRNNEVEEDNLIEIDLSFPAR
ncbi:hypothetical protein RND71_019994 [Anisodus tanguticus]|uniref:Uncharacterized protein n=1 Tax=Anisodus tanguticus TaxID=243964 RepID=A0AAE1V9U4_9SOLA|nr:hypothetical protein RND71_019994 [Anisodus tanguticus]